MTFEELGLDGAVLKALAELGFETPTPIQEQAVPALLNQQRDLVGLAQTGTGKTAAFGLPLINNINPKKSIPQGLVLCPTRELCLQITKDLETFSKYLDLNIVSVYGGTDIRRQMSDIKRGAAIIVATPGRLMDLINRRAIALDDVKIVILDEADEMLNMGFKEDLDSILKQTPDEKNVWLFSATMPTEVSRIASNYMSDPFEVSVGHKNQSNENIEHTYYQVKEKDRFEAVKRLIDFNPTIFGLVFCRTRMETASVAEKLAKDGYNAEPLHGDLTQAMRDRVMDRFRRREIQLLVATDVAARGLDIDNITHVINYNLPDDIENYTHRSGRTARAGKTGKSLIFINARETGKIRQLERQLRVPVTKGLIPSAADICEVQLMQLVSRVEQTEVKEKDISRFIPMLLEKFENLSKEEVIKKFISMEFNRFIEYYERAGDLNIDERDKGGRGRDRDRDFEGGFERGGRERRDRNDRGGRSGNETEAGKTRFFVSIGREQNFNPGAMVRVICDATGLRSNLIGRIQVMGGFSFFEADSEHTNTILKNVNGQNYEGNTLRVEITKDRDSGGSGGGSRSGGGRSSGGFSGGGRPSAGRSFGDRPERERRSSGDRKPYGEKRSFGSDRSSSGSRDRKPGGFGRKPKY
jgi:ATP-dependent RNA helicase DeaD